MTEEAVWKKHHGGNPWDYDLVRAGRIVIGDYDIVEWEVRKTHDNRYRAVNNYFTWAEAWDNAWVREFRTESEAVAFARKQAKIAQGVMQASHDRHGRADAQEVAEVVNVGRYEPPPPELSGGDSSARNSQGPSMSGSREEKLGKAVYKGVKAFVEFMAARDLLESEDVLRVMKSIEGHRRKVVVRAIFGKICLERRSGSKKIKVCEMEPVGPRYVQIAGPPLEIEVEADLDDKDLYPEIWGAFEGEEMLEYEEADIKRMVKKLYPDGKVVLKLQGTAEFYGTDDHVCPGHSLNGPTPGDKDVLKRAVLLGVQTLAELQMAELHILASRSEDMGEIEKLGGKALVRVVLGNVCLETGEGMRRIQRLMDGSFLPVPPRFRLLHEDAINVLYAADLRDERVYREIFESFDGQDDQDYEQADLDRMLTELFKTQTPAMLVIGRREFYTDAHDPSMNGGISPSSSGEGTQNFLGDKDEPTGAYNLINHVSDWDGSLRSFKAMYALKRFHPLSAGQIARIWMEERFPLKEIEDVEFPMFLENPDLVKFVLANLSPEDSKWVNWYITRWDMTDSVADMWKLSPELQAAYPTHDRWFQGVNIGKGWQDLLQQVQTILERAGW